MVMRMGFCIALPHICVVDNNEGIHPATDTWRRNISRGNTRTIDTAANSVFYYRYQVNKKESTGHCLCVNDRLDYSHDDKSRGRLKSVTSFCTDDGVKLGSVDCVSGTKRLGDQIQNESFATKCITAKILHRSAYQTEKLNFLKI